MASTVIADSLVRRTRKLQTCFTRGQKRHSDSIQSHPLFLRTFVAPSWFRRRGPGDLRRNRLPPLPRFQINIGVSTQALKAISSGPQSGRSNQRDVSENMHIDVLQFVFVNVRTFCRVAPELRLVED